jgi:hypothetical protein
VRQLADRSKIEARLRKRLDEDLLAATRGIDSGELSELVRNGLRLMLGIRTHKQVEVYERPISTVAFEASLSVASRPYSSRIGGTNMSVIGFYSTKSRTRNAIYHTAVCAVVTAQVLILGKVR